MQDGIAPLAAGDERAWRALWHEFVADVGAQTSDKEMNRTWTRLMEPESGMYGLAARAQGVLAGFVLYATFPYPWGSGTACYMIDLGVSATFRGRGLARQLIEALAKQGRQEGWNHVFWYAQAENAAARRLYDRLAEQSPLVRYDMTLHPVPERS